MVFVTTQIVQWVSLFHDLILEYVSSWKCLWIYVWFSNSTKLYTFEILEGVTIYGCSLVYQIFKMTNFSWEAYSHSFDHGTQNLKIKHVGPSSSSNSSFLLALH